MKKLGNLAVVVAQSENASLAVLNGMAHISLGEPPNREVITCGVWDDEKIERIIEKINFPNGI